MLNSYHRGAAAWLCAWLLGLPFAHAAERPPAGQVTAAPFDRYQSWREEPLVDWREANKRVGEIGGWRTYLREVQQGGAGDDHGRHDHHDHHRH